MTAPESRVRPAAKPYTRYTTRSEFQVMVDNLIFLAARAEALIDDYVARLGAVVPPHYLDLLRDLRDDLHDELARAGIRG